MRRAGITAAGLMLAAQLVLAGGSGDQGASNTEGGSTLTGDILVDGSSTVYPITEAMAEEFGLIHRNARVTVGISGSGGGFKKFCAGETDVTNASRPIKKKEAELCAANGISFVELPVAFDGLAVLVHPDNDWAETMTMADLKKIWAPEAQGWV